MKVMVFVKASPESEAGVMPEQQLLTDMMNYNEQLVKAGIMLSGDGLQPTSKGARVHFSGKNRTVLNGPFAETKELVAGFWIWQVKSLEEAIEWVKRCPNPMLSDSDIEIRPFYSFDDFGDIVTPDIQAQAERLQAQADKLAGTPPGDAAKLDEPRFEDGKPRVFAGLKAHYTNETRANIPAQWQRFVPLMGKVPGQVGSASYGVCWNGDAGCNFDYLTAVEVTGKQSLPAELTELKVPAHRYAIFTHRQHVSALPRTLEAIFTKWLPASGYKAVHAPCFERYDERFNPQTGGGELEIWVPIQA